MHRFKYSIEFNDSKRTVNKYYYDYSQTKDINVKIGNNFALVEFVMTRYYNKEDFVNLSCGVFKDAYRKIYLAHVFLYGKTFKFKKIKISIQKGIEIEQFTIEKELMSSLLSDKFKCRILFSKNLIDKIMNQPQYKINEDMCFCSAQSYLYGCEKENEIDIFSNYWTSLNAMYSYRSKMIVEESKRIINFKKATTPRITDSVSIFIAIHLLNGNDLSGEEYKKYNEVKKDKQLIKSFEKKLENVPVEDFCKIYSYAEEMRIADYKDGLFKQINQSLEDRGVHFLGFILYLYPYHYRCEYVHGSLSLPIICAHNDFVLHSLKFMNYCLNRYLENEIPKIPFEKMNINENEAKGVYNLLK